MAVITGTTNSNNVTVSSGSANADVVRVIACCSCSAIKRHVVAAAALKAGVCLGPATPRGVCVFALSVGPGAVLVITLRVGPCTVYVVANGRRRSAVGMALDQDRKSVV